MWNTVYIDLAVNELRKHRQIDDTLLPHVSPLGWGHIILTGDYDWGADKQLRLGEYRSLRPVPSAARRSGGEGEVGGAPSGSLR